MIVSSDLVLTMSDYSNKMLFVGAGSIAQSIIKGIVKVLPDPNQHILVTAPSMKNLEALKTLGCQTVLMKEAIEEVSSFEPDVVFLCVKPQVLLKSVTAKPTDMLLTLLNNLPRGCLVLSVIAGVKIEAIANLLGVNQHRVVRFMVNTAAEIRSSSIFYYAHSGLDEEAIEQLERTFSLMGPIISRIADEHLMDVATGVCGSGIAFLYEVIQAISDVAVKNGLARADATLVAALLSKSAGEMILTKRVHPYHLRDEVTSPAGTTIQGISTWHDNSTNQQIGRAVQASIDKAIQMSSLTESKFKKP